MDIIRACERISRENVKTSGKEHPGYYDLKPSEEWYDGIVKEHGPNE